MPDSKRQQVRQIFMDVAELADPERAAALEKACGDDAALRAEVEALLRAERKAGAFMLSPTEGGVPRVPAGEGLGADEAAGAMIGRYRLLEQIGEGGMGTIWMAEQREPVKRRVALKIIKLGMDTKQVIARFEAERQALAMMDHPNIAKVFDAGATETGRPYFVMEYIKGIPILQYCDQEHADTRARLVLLTSVCHAIQHAHQKGVIHRDIKPSNVLVTLHDGIPVPKVIDFGIAKATNAELTSKTLFTEHRQMLGTPAYMSPEQAEMSGLDIDTRSDIYSLGVLLYELLTGTTPFDMKELFAKGFAEMMRTIREDEPHKPSTRISTLGDVGTRTAMQRNVDAKRLGSLLRGDIDWIVMKCLEKDRTHRYETASGLAADIKRHLSDEPVTAGAPSAAYRLRKFVKRNRGQVMAVAVVAAALVLGVIGTTTGMLRAQGEKRRADAEATKATLAAAAESKAKVEAQENARTAMDEARRAEASKEEEAAARKSAEAISDFVILALKQGDAMNVGGGQDVTILAAMDSAIADLDSGRFTDDPETEAALKNTIAAILRNNGKLDESLSLAEQALEIRERIYPGDDEKVAASLNEVAQVDERLGRYAQAEQLMLESLQMYQRLYQGDNAHVGALLNNLAELRGSLGRTAEAEPLMLQSLEMHQRLYKGDHRDVARCLDNLAKLWDSLGRYAEAETLYVQALEMAQRLYPGDHPQVAVHLNNLAVVRSNLGRRKEAEPLFRQALEMRRRLYKGDHPVVAESLTNLAVTELALGKPAEAEKMIAEALDMNRRVYPGDHPNVAHSLYSLATVQFTLGHFEQAESVSLESVEMHRRIFNGDHEGVAMSLLNLASARRALHKPAEERRSLDEALAMLRRLAPGGSSGLLQGLWQSARARMDAGDSAAALPELEEAVAVAERILPPGNSMLLDCRERLASCKEAIASKSGK